MKAKLFVGRNEEHGELMFVQDGPGKVWLMTFVKYADIGAHGLESSLKRLIGHLSNTNVEEVQIINGGAYPTSAERSATARFARPMDQDFMPMLELAFVGKFDIR